MDIKFDAVHLECLRQIKGYADLKQRELDAATRTAADARTVLQQYLQMMLKIHGLEGKQVQILEDFSGFRMADPPPAPPNPEKGDSTA